MMVISCHQVRQANQHVDNICELWVVSCTEAKRSASYVPEIWAIPDYWIDPIWHQHLLWSINKAQQMNNQWQYSSDVKKLVKMRISTSNIRRMQMPLYKHFLSIGKQCTGFCQMIATIYCFIMSMKSVFKSVHCNTSLSKNNVAHSITVV